MSNRVP